MDIMSNPPLVTVITPTTEERQEHNERIKDVFARQNYPNKEHLFNYDKANIGAKRNELCSRSNGSIILHMDSDDWYHEDWITHSVMMLKQSKSYIVGLKTCMFYDERGTRAWSYAYLGTQPYLLGATFCYYKSLWERNNFQDVMVGEDAKFLANAGHIVAHNFKDGFIAMIHGKNTASHLTLPLMQRIDVTPAQNILRQYELRHQSKV